MQRQKEIVAISEELESMGEKIKNSEFDLEEVSEKSDLKKTEREAVNKQLREKQVHLGGLRERLGEQSFEARQREVDLKKLNDEIYQVENQLKKDEKDLEEQKKEISRLSKHFKRITKKEKTYRRTIFEAIESELKKTKDKPKVIEKTYHQFELLHQLSLRSSLPVRR